MKILFIDTETTGLEPGKHAVIQIAGIIEIDGEVKEEFNFFASPHPGQLYEARALEVNKRTIEEIKGFPPPLETYDALKKIFSKYVSPYTKDVRQRFVIAGHNVAFDYAMMEAFWQKCGDRYWYSWVDFRGLDTVTATALFQAAGRISLPNFKLETVANSLNIPLKAHNAMDDIRATREIYHRYINMIKEAK